MRATSGLVEPALRMSNADRMVREKRNTDAYTGNVPFGASVLYRYLEMDRLIGAFAGQLQGAVPVDCVSFKNPSLSQSIDISLKPSRSPAKYQLDYSLGDQSFYLGDLSLSRHRQFLSAEIRRINRCVDSLIGPLKNATLYKRACQSAYFDSLTGVQNRAALDATLSCASQDDNSIALMVCDIDRFKSINDNFGHKTGDAALQQFAQVLRSKIRKGDLIYRYGGDEFVVIFYGNSLASARESAERIRRSIEQTSLHINDACINLTTTIGITGLRAGETLDEAFLRADAALLSGKKNGKNTVVCQ